MFFRRLNHSPLTSVVFFFIFTLISVVGYAATEKVEDTKVQASESSLTVSEFKRLEITARLTDIHASIREKLKFQQDLQKDKDRADASYAAELKLQIEGLNRELSSLRKNFEQVAIGGVDLESFGGQSTEFDWRKEIILVTQPLLESLKSLTEKPRKIERLKGILELRKQQKSTIENAIDTIERNLTLELPKNIKTALVDVQKRWKQRLEDNKRETELARYQLASLQGENTPWIETIQKTLNEFFQGRGLTLLMAVGASFAIWLFTRLLLWLVQRRLRDNAAERRKKTRYRLAAYAYTLFTSLLVGIAVMVVFYARGDILLLALSIIALAAIALGMRNFLPGYISEAKLLLNVGSIREGERVIYRGLPWMVKSINMYSVFRNPELEGSLRLPLAELQSQTSRACVGEDWFPSSQGDLVMMPDVTMAEVVRQTPDAVYLRSKGGMLRAIPAIDFFNLGVFNLSRGESFSVSTIFGIDYQHQKISLTEVPKAFETAIRQLIEREGLNEQLVDVVVDLKAAGASSIDYLCLVILKSPAASSYFKMERLLQQTCIAVCNERDWGIPFPQVTVHLPEPAVVLKKTNPNVS